VYLVNLDNDEQQLPIPHPDRRPLYPIPSIRRDGGVVLVGYNHDERNGIIAINAHSGEGGVLVETRLADRPSAFHATRLDVDQLLSRGARTETIPDRMWAWHAEHAPQGQRLWDHGAAQLCIGHEVACRHDMSVLAVGVRRKPGLAERVVRGVSRRVASRG